MASDSRSERAGWRCATRDSKLEYWCNKCAVPECHPCWSHGEHKGPSTSPFTDVCGALRQTLLEKAGRLVADGTVSWTRRRRSFRDKVQVRLKELQVTAVSWHTRADAGKAVANLGGSDGVAACAFCGQGVPERSLAACDGCKQGMCSGACLCHLEVDSLELAKACHDLGRVRRQQGKCDEAL
eukprot:Rhum_TRINITY_DN10657_c0_g2::Rhum_TRINITY_DN10657_c0_g2_i1::g.39487::m.39487